MGGGDH